MDYELLNAIGITVMAAFGLWVFQKVHKDYTKINKEKSKNREELKKEKA